MSIRSFSDRKTRYLFETGKVEKGTSWSEIKHIALRKLDMLDYAKELVDLRSPPGNRLEKLKGELADRYSIRINDQRRIVFQWTKDGPLNVGIIDYH